MTFAMRFRKEMETELDNESCPALKRRKVRPPQFHDIAEQGTPTKGNHFAKSRLSDMFDSSSPGSDSDEYPISRCSKTRGSLSPWNTSSSTSPRPPPSNRNPFFVSPQSDTSNSASPKFPSKDAPHHQTPMTISCQKPSPFGSKAWSASTGASTAFSSNSSSSLAKGMWKGSGDISHTGSPVRGSLAHRPFRDSMESTFSLPVMKDFDGDDSPMRSPFSARGSDSPDAALSDNMRRKCSLVPSPEPPVGSPSTPTVSPLPAPPPPTKPIQHFSHHRSAIESHDKQSRYEHDTDTRDSFEGGTGESSRFDFEFEVLGVLGNGTFGTVYKCKKRLDGCLYAVKVTKQRFRGRADRERVLKEVYALSALHNSDDNPHIVRYFSAWVEDARLYIQTELCDMSLEDMLLKRKQGSDEVDTFSSLESIIVEMLRQILMGLSHLHGRNLVHLDIKPANIFIKNGTYKLGDLGHACLARMQSQLPASPKPEQVQVNEHGMSSLDEELALAALAEEELEVSGCLTQVDEGDARYMALELLQENHSELPKADVFSLGASAYEMLCGEPLPGNGETWNNIRNGKLDHRVLRQVSKPLQDLIRLMMHQNPRIRPSADTLLTTGGPAGLLRTEAENELAREKNAASAYRKELAKLRRGGPVKFRRVNTM